MKKIIITKLAYTEVRGQTKSIEFNDEGTTTISGHNGSGKSTVFNAFLWLITSFDAEDRSNYNLFDENSDEDAKTCSVTAYFLVDGSEAKLHKKARQNMVRSRESGEKYRKGDSYEYFVNDMKCNAKFYNDFVEEHFGNVSRLKIMLNPNYYRLIEPSVLRGYLSEIAGDVRPEEFKKDYKAVIDIINEYGAAGAKKYYANKIKENEEQLRQLNARISATEDVLPNIEDISNIESNISSLESQRSIIESRRNALSLNDTEFINKRKEQETAIYNKKREMEEARDKHESEREAKIRAANDEFENIKRTNKENVSRRRILREKIKYTEERIEDKKKLLESLRVEYSRVNNLQFSNICPECGSEYKGENFARAINRFNDKKKSDLVLVKQTGITEKKNLETLTSELESLKAELENTKDLDVTEAENKLYELRKTLFHFDSTEYEKEIARMESERIEIPENEELKSILLQLGEINSRLATLNRELGVKDAYERGKSNIDRMKFDIRCVECEKGDNIGFKNLVEDYQREYADIVRSHVNVKFKRVVVEMTRPNKSGQLEDVCNLSIDGVSNTVNSASEKIIGCEVCEAFQSHYGTSLPLFIDGSECMNDENIPEHDGQRIILKVTENDFKVE